MLHYMTGFFLLRYAESLFFLLLCIYKLLKHITWNMFLSVTNLCSSSELRALTSLLSSVYVFRVYLMFTLEIFVDI